jgi:hypothetical protein
MCFTDNPTVRPTREAATVPAVLQKGEILSASVDVDATADRIYSIVSDVTRIPQWSPEVVRVEKLSADSFQAWNRRRLGRWKTAATIVEAIPGRRFSFVVQALGGDWTQWTYALEPHAGGTRLTQQFRMCVAMPMAVLMFERLALLVMDRRTDLQSNMETSVQRIMAMAESDDKEYQ